LLYPKINKKNSSNKKKVKNRSRNSEFNEKEEKVISKQSKDIVKKRNK
jgi:hypothetical protein